MQQPNDGAVGPDARSAATSGRTMPWPSGPSRSRSHGRRGAARRPLRDRRRLRRPVGGGCGRPARRVGGADREAQDGRRLPQLRLRALQGADRGGPPGPSDAHLRAVRHRADQPDGELQGRARPHPTRHRLDRPQRLGGALRRPRRQGDPRRRPVHLAATPWPPATRASRRAASSSPPARRRRCRPSPGSTACPTSPTRPSSRTARSSTTSSSSAAARSASSSPRRICASAPASPCWRR